MEKLNEEQFLKMKNDIFNDLKLFLFKPLSKIFKLFFKLLLGNEKVNSFEASVKIKMKTMILNIIHKTVFKTYPNFSEIVMLFLNHGTKNLKKQLKNHQYSVDFKKYERISSFDVDKEFSFCKGSQSTQPNSKELYQNAIDQLNLIKTKHTPIEKIDTISKIHTKIWGSIIKCHDNNDNKIFLQLREKFDADNLISLYSYVIFNSKNYNLHKEIAFIEEFLEEKLLNEYNNLYYFEMFKSALEYVTNHIIGDSFN